MNSVMIGWISLIVFVLTIFVGVKKKVNLGILALGVGFILGLFVYVEGGTMSSLALKGKPITSLFPFNIFWMIVSVSLMLNVGAVNGAFDIVIKKLVNLAGGRRSLIPIYVFLIMMISCVLGMGTSGVVILLCTVAANIARDQKIDPIFMLLSVLTGTTAAIGSPVAIIGIICNGYAEEFWGQKIAPNFMLPHAVALATCSFIFVYVVFKGWKLERWPKTKAEDIPKLNGKQILSLVGLGAFILLSIVAGFDIGLSAFLVAAVLLLLGCADEKKVIATVPWSSVILISGMSMLIGIVKVAGGMELLTNALKVLMNRFTVKPLYSMIGSLLAMVSSTTGVILPSMVPTIPDIAVSTGVNPFALVTALAFGANSTVTSPISSMGAIALGVMSGNPEWNSSTLFKRQLFWAVLMMCAASLWAAIGVAG